MPQTTNRPAARRAPDARPRPLAYPGEKARQGTIILRSRLSRWIFAGALAACAIVILALGLTAVI